MWFVYLLEDTKSNRTYVGATLDVDRRLQQHNGELAGGAKATSGRTWKRVCYISGFPHEKAALQFEWAWKYVSKKQNGNPIERRVKAMLELLGCDQPTSKATDYKDYVHNLSVVWEHEIDAILFL
jgi:structure-specific endonuclease subunit SLX1